MKNEEKYWNELKRATKKLLKEGCYSDEIKIQFLKEEDEISIFTQDKRIDNCYDKKEGSRWEIFLNKDGTWKIS